MQGVFVTTAAVIAIFLIVVVVVVIAIIAIIASGRCLWSPVPNPEEQREQVPVL